MVHFNFAPAPLPEGVELTKREADVQGRVQDWLENHMGYAIMMRTRPHTIGCSDDHIVHLMTGKAKADTVDARKLACELQEDFIR